MPKLFVIFIIFLLCSFGVDAQINREAAIAYNEAIGLIKEKKYGEAIQAYSAAIKAKPDYTKAYYNRGKTYLRTRRYQAATEDFKKVLTLDADNAKAAYYAGYAYLKQEDYQGAIIHFNKAIEIDPEFQNAYENRALAFMREEKYALAKKDYAQVLQQDETDMAARFNHAICAIKTNARQEVLADYNIMIEGGYKELLLRKERAKIYVQQEDYAAAMEDLAHLTQKNIDDYEIYYLSGVSQMKLEEIEAAHANFVQALELKPAHQPSLKNLAFTSFKLQDYDNAEAAYSRLLTQSKEDKTLWLNRGLARLNKEAWQGAYDDFSKTISLDESSAIAYYNRANAAAGLMQYEEACADMRQSARLGYEAAFDHIAALCNQ